MDEKKMKPTDNPEFRSALRIGLIVLGIAAIIITLTIVFHLG
jgi:hypothetical protein